MEELRSQVIKEIRACLSSTKDKLSLQQLTFDYKTLRGERIPYEKLGFRSLENLIASEPTFEVIKRDGQVFVRSTSEKSAHISQMVAKQKSAKKTLRRTPEIVRFSKPMPAANWRPKHVKNKKYTTTSRPAAVSHNQFLDTVSYKAPSVPSKIVVPETSTLAVSEPGPSSKAKYKKFDVIEYLQGNNNKSNKGKDDEMPNARTKIVSQKMSEINRDRDSGNSSPINEISQSITQLAIDTVTAGDKNTVIDRITVGDKNTLIQLALFKEDISKKEPIETGDHLVDLKALAEYHKIGEVEASCLPIRTKQNRLYTCRIKVGKHSYTSYPKEFTDPSSAQTYCAKEAFKDLKAKFGKRKSLLVSNERDILERIPPMLQKHSNDIWAWQIQLDYADKYNEQLPLDWLKIIDSSPVIQVQKFGDGYVVRHCKPQDKGGRFGGTPTPISTVSVPSNTIQLTAEGRGIVEVTCAMSANELWCRQCDTEETIQFVDAMGRMEMFYNLHGTTLKVNTITENCYYAAKYGNSWHRVRALKVEDEEVLFFLIDSGDEIMISKEDICELKREFATSQAQAFVCRLVGLEDLYESSAGSENLQHLMLYKKVHLEMEKSVLTEDDPCLPVYMYDFQTSQCINEELIQLLAIESASPVIKEGIATEVYISNIESNGDVYVQIHSGGYEHLKRLLADLEAQILANPPTHLVTPVSKFSSKGVTYFAQNKKDRHWYRVQIIDWSPKEDLAQIYFVDYGNTHVINVKEEVLYPLHRLDDVLNQYPAQAVRVRMDLDMIPEDFVDQATKAMPRDQPALIKLTGKEQESLPLATFFRRDPNGELFCVNMSITMKAQMKKEDIHASQNRYKKKLNYDSLNVPSGGKLSCPPLPKKGEYLEVHVPFAVNPYNFFIQPRDSQTKLHKMMEALQERYRSVLYSPLQLDQIMPGNIYASRFDDGHWYRTTVIKVINSGSISVFYCDFGYYATLSVHQLYPLDLEFLELPYQALKAKLAGIKPKQSKWTMDDCDYFKQLVEKKHFYSVLFAMDKDELYDSDIVLSLVLVDTSSSDDIIIGNELIKIGIAVED